MSKKMTSDANVSQVAPKATEKHIQRPPAEVLHAEELATLQQSDHAAKPWGWKLSMPAVRSFVLGDQALGLSPKMVCPPSLIERAMVTLASNRALLLVGEPGTAKSLLSELMAAAISFDSTLTIQGSAATTEDQLKYGWNYALLLNEGPSKKALVPSPLYRAMQEGKIVRFEELTRCPPEVQDGLLSILSERLLMVPELSGANHASADDSTIFANKGFNLIATANTRDRGVNEMSAALKRRFSFETVFAIRDYEQELALVEQEVNKLLKRDQIPLQPNRELLDVLVTTFRDLRQGIDREGGATEKLATVVSTAEAVSVAHAITLRGYYLRGDNGKAADLVEALAGAAIKDNPDDAKKIRRYLDHKAAKKKTPAWQAFYAARHLLAD